MSTGATTSGPASAVPAAIPFIHRVYRVLGSRFRRKRIADFLETFGVTSSTRILDVGGTRSFWRDIPAQVTAVNLDPGDSDQVADARNLPFDSHSFDIVFSNSLIEHVGGWQDQVACAREIARVGVRYYVQTPNLHFPIEPHFLAPFVHWIPLRWRKPFIRFTPWAILMRADSRTIDEYVDHTKLLTTGDMKKLFPDAQLKYERFCGMSKSIIAQRL